MRAKQPSCCVGQCGGWLISKCAPLTAGLVTSCCGQLISTQGIMGLKTNDRAGGLRGMERQTGSQQNSKLQTLGKQRGPLQIGGKRNNL